MAFVFGKIGDAGELARIHDAAFSNGWSEKQLADLLAFKHNYVIKQSGSCFVLFQILAEECEVITMAVVPDAQGQGSGAQLLEEMLGVCRESGVKKVFLEVSEVNKKARCLYEKFAFAEYNQRKAYYADGQNALLLQLQL